ncbi:MAG TPA: mandelate racemase/muconate lactonizing enzyme family protein [Bryobacteraceae bacterium]|nr:mandelate racemase/muconate lactonizing enzyme family protein [Bryobacteraceae bacterium]
MRITALKTTIVAIPFTAPEKWAWGGRGGLANVILEMETDEGVTGLGEAGGYPTPDIVVAVIRSLEALVVGENPFHIERILKRMYAVGGWHHVRASSPGIAAVEVACWDIVGKVCRQPLVNLFGGPVRDRVEYMYYLIRKPAAQLREDARDAVRRGFRTLYLKVGGNRPEEDIELVAAIREGAGPDALIRVDANEAWSPGAAIRIIRELERYKLELVEQPVSARNLPEMAYVRGQIQTPVLANEASWTRNDALDVIRNNAADVVSVDFQMDGGLLNMKRSAGLCEIAGLPVLKHSLGELGIATYAAAHVIASTPNFLHANQAYASFLADDVIEGSGPLPYKNGCLAIPQAPGIGVTLDRDKLGRYAELYRKQGNFGFYEPEALVATPLIPKI